MSRSPNAEQKKAIEHEGGVLLKAGAGSGKTFVLVEHIVFRTRAWITEARTRPGTLEEFLREKFSQVVMMTFTKKAAGEMSIRLTDRFRELALTEADGESWRIAEESLPHLLVTTIDGFCRKLITSGYFPHLATEAKIIFENERMDQVARLFADWLEEDAREVPSEILEIVLREKTPLLKSLTGIFNDPGLRLSWKTMKPSDAAPAMIDGVLAQSFKLGDVESALVALGNLDLPHEKERSAFERLVATFQATGLPIVESVEKLHVYGAIFSGIKRLISETSKDKKELPGHLRASEGLKALKAWWKDWDESVRFYTDDYEGKIVPWVELFLRLFRYIDSRLDPNHGLTFGDVAYYVAQGLELRESADRIQKTFRYFIVDEFQDTSHLQFQIIRRLIAEDFQRLFCVGDAKQAIYGFRGGELSVFQDCEDLIPLTLSLSNNYRSLPTVIEFNNSLFRTLFPLGQGYSGADPFPVPAQGQAVPGELEFPDPGVIETISATLELEEDRKLRTDEINLLEAHLLGEAIADQRRKSPGEVCTVLYSKLKPSADLIKILMHKKIGFTAQFKIDVLDEPVVGMFLALLKRTFDKRATTKERFPLFVFQSYLKVLGIDRAFTEELFEIFDLDSQYWGVLNAFRKLLHKLQITNENSDLNLGLIETLALIYDNDPEAMLRELRLSSDRISLDFRSGEHTELVQIMSAHASKGLEFDTVFLGGIYTNGKDRGDGQVFGKRPGSFKWYRDLSVRDIQRSPFYLFEDELNSYKGFSENKRLFYVACTRAKKRLKWIDIDFPEKAFNPPKSSWVHGLRHWNSVSAAPRVSAMAAADFDVDAILASASGPALPMYFYDPVGIFEKTRAQAELTISAELSVTRLNSLVDCPRKFYLQNTLKLNPPQEQSFFKPSGGEDEVVVSSADRGTAIHAFISEGLSRNFTVPRAGMEHSDAIAFALGELKALASDFDFVSEVPLKFNFFNFMISGTPDLYLLPRGGEQSAQVWDFKTGRITESGLAHYWLQLKTYAYALYTLKLVDRSCSIKTKLCFVDQKKILELEVNWSSIEAELFALWRSQNEPWKINSDHCAQCSYGDICPR